MTQAELDVCTAALKAEVDILLSAKGEEFEEFFIPSSAYATGASYVIAAADGSKDQSDAARKVAGQLALKAALDSTGQGGQVTPAEIASCTTAILIALANARSKKSA